ncbi:class I SAM-dependent methyltransferase [Luteipulveratus halotolerans]|nr:class I SAM-dependent methyltransferase [Luteipulveratus halotolerans]
MTYDNAQQFWDDFYGERDAVWSGKPNGLLVEGVSGLEVGTALDLGAGEGADAIWLAEQGWAVTAVDISDVALDRARGHAAGAGADIVGRIDWQQCDLDQGFPEGEFDLVSAQFLHSPMEQPDERVRILRRSSAAVAPGGALLIGSHAGWPVWDDGGPDERPSHRSEAMRKVSGGHDHYEFLSTAQLLGHLALPEQVWTVALDQEISSPFVSDGRTGTRSDSIVRLHRRSSLVE